MNDPRDITHNLRTAIIGADGKLVKVYTGNEWSPEQVLADLKTLSVAELTSGLSRTVIGTPTPVHAARAAADRGAADAARGAGYLNALPYNQEPGGRATLRSFRGVVRTGARTASRRRCSPPWSSSSTGIRRCSSASSRSTARSRDLRLPATRTLGIDRAVARSRACTGASRCSPRRARWRAATWIRTSISPAASPATSWSNIARADGRLRLAAGRHERVEGRTRAARLSAPAAAVVGRARRPAARAVPRVPER